MTSLKSWMQRPVAASLVVLMLSPLAVAQEATPPAATTPQTVQQTTPQTVPQTAPQTAPPTAAPADAPVRTQLPAPAAPAETPQQQQPDASKPVEPVGTAVAPAVNGDGTPVSRPAGAAIAPAKQKRIRTYALRAALLVGAAVAIGVVIAASSGSPSRPN